MKNAHIKYDLYLLLGKFKREGKESIEVRKIMKELGYNRFEPDAMFFVAKKVIELEYKVKVYARKESN